jgi:hypothetical protein
MHRPASPRAADILNPLSLPMSPPVRAATLWIDDPVDRRVGAAGTGAAVSGAMPDPTQAIATIPAIDLARITGGVDDAPADSSAQQPPLPTRRPCVPFLQDGNPDHLPQCPVYIGGVPSYPR